MMPPVHYSRTCPSMRERIGYQSLQFIYGTADALSFSDDGVPTFSGTEGYNEGTSNKGFSLSMMSPNPGRSPGSAQVCTMRLEISGGSVSGTGSLALSHPTAPTTCA